jgi:phosphate-selective porin
MLTSKFTRLALLGAALFSASQAFAQDSGPLLDALVRKGILNDQEAEEMRADLIRDNNTIPAKAIAGGKSTDRISVGMRMQIQYANLDTNIDGVAVGPVATSHFFLRRMYLSLKAGIGGNWGANMTYDLASGSYDDANIEWKPTADLVFNFGLRKVNLGYEERATSANIRSIERSIVTRYFVESNNGRRLGAASYRIGAFLDGKRELSSTYGLVYSVAVTSPERNESLTGASSAGDSTNNGRLALWGNVGLTGKFANNGTWIAGVGAGLLPDQGGFGVANLGKGFDLNVYSAYTDITSGRFSLMAEYLTADVKRGASATADAKPYGYYIQPSYLVTDTVEAVLRFASLDTDHRGVSLSDVVRSSASGGTMNKAIEWFGGANWYLRGNDLKYQLGVVYGKTKDTVTGAPAAAKVLGVRSQMQLQF